MVKTVSTKKNNRGTLVAATFLGILALGSSGAQTTDQERGLTYDVSLLVGVSRTDNILLLPASEAIDETVYQLAPSVSVDYSSDRIQFNGQYQFNHYDYRTLATDNQTHQYDVSMSNELVEDAFFFDLGGSRTQSVVDPDAIIPPGNLQITNNLVDRDDYYFSPRIDKMFANSVRSRVEYRYEDVSFDESETDDVLDSVNENALFQLDNLARQSGLTFLLAYEWEQSEYDSDVVLPWEYQKAGGDLGYWVDNSLRIFGGGGQESAWDDPVDRSLQDGFWEVGFELLGSGRFRAEFAGGKRSFGDSWRGDAEIKFRRGELQFRYEQAPRTTAQDRFNTGLLNPNDPNDVLVRPGSAERYISKRGEANLSLEFRRLGLDLMLFDEERVGRFQADGTELPDEAQQGATFTFSFQAGSRTEIVGEASTYTRQTEGAGDVDFRFADLSFNYQILSRLTLSLAYEYGQQSPAADSTALEYESNLVSLFVTYSIRN